MQVDLALPLGPCRRISRLVRPSRGTSEAVAASHCLASKPSGPVWAEEDTGNADEADVAVVIAAGASSRGRPPPLEPPRGESGDMHGQRITRPAARQKSLCAYLSVR